VQVADVNGPFDAVPDPLGQTIYFSAYDTDAGPGIFRVPANASNLTPTPVSIGPPWVMPLSLAISSDGMTVYVADPGATNASNGNGAIFSVSLSGASPIELQGTAGTVPTGVTVSSDGGPDVLLFAGRSPATGFPSVFSTPAAGGTPSVIASGAPLLDPEAIAILPSGDLLVVDALAGSGGVPAVMKISSGSASLLAGLGTAGWPSGIVWSPSMNTVLVSARITTDGGAELPTLDSATGALSHLSFGPSRALVDPAGLRRASRADVYTWVDGAGGAIGGRIFVITH
jgi:DNA-binding beta-propeller fold protein YncE